MTTLKQLCRIRFALPALAVAMLLLGVRASRADLLELVNGDHYSGTVIALTRTNLEFQSDIQGLVKIPRDKIAKITLRESVPKAVAKLPAVPPATPDATNAPAGTNSIATDAVVQQMRLQGVDPNMMNQIQQQVLGQSSPEATRMFNNMVGGLMSGSLSVEDIRVQARKAIQDIQATKKDLAGDAATAELLDGYLGILQKFVGEADAPAPAVTAATPAPAPKPGAPATVNR